MALSYTKHTLEKLEQILEILHYTVRYDKGNFKTGACVLENSKIIVINKFSSAESRVISIVNLLNTIEMQNQLLTDKQQQFINSLTKSQLQV